VRESTIRPSLLAVSKQVPVMRTLYIRHVPDEVAARLEKLAAQAGLPLSTFALQELTESARRADNAKLLNALPSLSIDHKTILEALQDSRAERLDAPLCTSDARLSKAPGIALPRRGSGAVSNARPG
jgi:predicted nucleic acid-binding protein